MTTPHYVPVNRAAWRKLSCFVLIDCLALGTTLRDRLMLLWTHGCLVITIRSSAEVSTFRIIYSVD